MCRITDWVMTICLHDCHAFDIVLCNDKICKGRVTTLKLVPGWCSECREALVDKFIDEKSLRKNATPLRAWASLAQIGKVDMIKPMPPAMIASAHLEKIDSKLAAQAEELWEKNLMARIGGFEKHLVRVDGELLSPVGTDQAKIRAVMERARQSTKKWVDEAK